MGVTWRMPRPGQLLTRQDLSARTCMCLALRLKLAISLTHVVLCSGEEELLLLLLHMVIGGFEVLAPPSDAPITNVRITPLI